MTTREQIKQVAQERENELCSNYQSFVLGAEYGYNLALEKVVEWLCKNMTETNYWCINAQAFMSKPELINNLKQAMKL